MTTRRTFLGSAVGSLLFALPALRAEEEKAPSRRTIFSHDLPLLDLKGHEVTAVEVTLPPSAASPKHRHPGFVIGYVLAGKFRFGLEGEAERTLQAGEMFYEPPGSIHAVSANASSTEPAKVLALIFAEKGRPLTTPILPKS